MAKTLETSIQLNFAEAKAFRKFKVSLAERLRLMDIISGLWKQGKINNLKDIIKCIETNIKR